MFLWRIFYPFKLVGFQVHNDNSYNVVCLRPTKKGFRSLYPCEKICSFRFGEYVAFYPVDLSQRLFNYNDFGYGSDLVFFAVGRFGRLRSLDITVVSLKKLFSCLEDFSSSKMVVK